MTEADFLAALPGPTQPQIAVTLPDYAAHQIAGACWARGWVEGGTLGITGQDYSLRRSFTGRLTDCGVTHLAQLHTAGAA